MKQSTFNVLLMSIVMCLGITVFSDHIQSKKIEIVHYRDSVVVHKIVIPESIEKDLYSVLQFYGVKYPHIVFAQAVLETGHFKSENCVKNNNLFGLYDSKNKRYYKFKHWTESVKAYKEYIQYRYKPDAKKPPNDEQYYRFLSKIGYAKDKDYISKVKNIVNRYEWID